MNPAITSALEALDGDLTPIRLLAERLAVADSLIDPRSGAALISKRPKIGTEAYACVIFPGVASDVIARYEELHRSRGDSSFEIPALYRKVLRRLNGAWAFQLSLYGLPSSMCQDPPYLDRSTHQPLDLATANLDWHRKYVAGARLFHFGSSPYSNEENVGYFLESEGGVIGMLKGGVRGWEWPSLKDFLTAELPRAESRFAAFEDRMAAISPPASQPQGNRKTGRGR